MRILLWLATGVVAVVAVAVGAIYVVLQTTDLAAYQGLVASKVEEATGRTLRIGGPVRVALSLHPTVIAEDVQFANAPGGAEPNMVTVARIEVQLALIPLLRRELRLDSLTLVQPRIVLQADIKGRPNWQFAASPAPGAAAATGGGGGVPILPFGALRIEDAVVIFIPAGRAPVTLTIQSAEIRETKLGGPMRLTAKADLNGESVVLSADGPPLLQLAGMAPSQSQWTVALSVAGAKLMATGTLNGAEVAGNIAIEVPDLSKLGKLAGVESVSAKQLSLKTNMTWSGKTADLRGMALNVGKSDLAGDIRVVLGSPRPSVTATLSSNRLDMADIAPPVPAASPSRNSATPATGGDGFAQPLPWDALTSMDAAVSLAAAVLVAPGLELGNTKLDVTLKNGALIASVSSATLAGGGSLTGTIKADASVKTPTVSVDLTGKQLAIGQLAGKTVRDALEGAIDTRVQLTGAGNTPQAIGASMNGSASALMGPGRARTKALDAAVSGMATLLGTLLAGDSEWTAVNCAAARFGVKNGLATSEVLLFDSPVATVAGEGTVNVGTGVLDLVVTPKPKSVTLNLATPVLIKGTISHPTFSPDPAALARKLGGILGIFVFPPAAILGLGELGDHSNPCLTLAQNTGGAGGGVPAAGPTTPAPANPLGGAIQDLRRGLDNLLGR